MTIEQPVMVPITDELYRLVEDYIYEWRVGSHGSRIKVPAGFISDGWSVPRWLWSVTGFRPDGIGRAAGLVHDYIYFCKGDLNRDPSKISWSYKLLAPQDPSGYDSCYVHLSQRKDWRPAIGRWSRKQADRLFAKMMKECGISKSKRRMAYLGVRIGGRF